MLDPQIRKSCEQIFNAANFIKEIGMSLDHLEPGICKTSLIILPKHLQQHGIVHAGVMATMADHTAGCAAQTLAPPELNGLTVEFKVNFLNAAKGEKLECRAEVLKAGRTITVAESCVYSVSDKGSKLVCKATVTMALSGHKLS